MILVAVGLLLAASLPAQTPQRCTPPFDGIKDCPQNFYPKPGFAGSKQLVDQELASALKAETKELIAVKALKGAVDADDGLRKAEVLRQIRSTKHSHYNKALEHMRGSFGMTPPVSDFTQVAGLIPAAQRIVPWQPRYSEQEIRDEVTGHWRQRNDKDPSPGPLGPPKAQTSSDGRISIFRASFVTKTRNPVTGKMEDAPDSEKLAIIVYHETIHWVRAVSEAGLRISPERFFSLESDDHTLTAAFAKSLNRPVEEKSSLNLAAEYSRRAALSKGQTWEQLLISHPNWVKDARSARPMSIPNPSAPFETGEGLKAGSDTAFYAAMRLETAPGREIVQGRQDLSDEALRRLEDSVRRAEEGRQREAREAEERSEFIRQGARFRYLSSVTGLACEDPDALAAEARRGDVATVGMDSKHLSEYMLMYPEGQGTTPCQASLLRRIRDAQDRVALEQVVAWGRSYRLEHPSPLERAARALQDFFSARSEYSNSGSREDGNSRQPNEVRNPSDDRGGRVPDKVNSPTYHYLKGIR